MKTTVTQVLLCMIFTVNLYATKVNSQNVLNKTFNLTVQNTSLNSLFRQIEKQTGAQFVFSGNAINTTRKISYTARNERIYAFLDAMKDYGIHYRVIDEQIVLFADAPAPRPATAARERKSEKLRNRLIKKDVTGTVTNDKGAPIAGATVTEKGTRNATVTDPGGRFTLSVEDNAVLEFSYVSYQTKELPVTASGIVNVQLSTSIQDMNEVVVVGYGTQRRANLTGAVDKIRSGALEDRPSVNLVQSLQGTSPSLVIQQRNFEPGQGLDINIRGVGTMGNNAPLIVVDGVAGGNLDMINPSDIESISVLKDAGAAAIYGSRSANGVLLVTTKKGRRNTGARLSYNGIVGVQQPKIWFRPVQSFENAILRNEANVNAGGNPVYTASQIQAFKDKGSEEWMLDAILKTAMQQNHNLSISGGGEKSTYLISGGYVNQRSNLMGPNLGLKRYNFRMNLTTEVGRLKVTGTFAYAKRRITDHSSSTGTLIVDGSRVPTYYKIKDSLGRYLTNETSSELNSLGILEKGGTRQYDDDDLFGSITGEYNFTSNLKLTGSLGSTMFLGHMLEHRKFVQFYMDGREKGSYGSERNLNERNTKNLFLNPRIQLDYTKTIHDHRISALAGYTNESYTGKESELRKKYVDNETGANTSETIIDESSKTSINGTRESSLNSAYGRLGYGFSDRYMAEFSFRYDGSSRFRKALRWGFFPSASAAWNITSEPFMKNRWQGLNTLKLRASYGNLGNQNVNDYQYLTTYYTDPNLYGFNNTAVSGAYYNLANPDIRWETASSFNAGIDAGLFNNRLSLSFDYFSKLTRDILVNPVVPGLYGGSVSDYNAGKLRNRGWETNISYTVQGAALRHEITLNVGDTKNEVVYIEGGEKISSSDEMQFILRKGLPFNSYVGLKTDGIFQNIDEVKNGTKPAGVDVQPGDLRFVDVDKNGVIDDKDRYVLGHPFPRYTFGFNYTVKWKQLDLSLFIQGVGKRSQFIRGELVEPFHYNYAQVMYQHQLDYWTPTNPDATYPRLASNGSASNTNNFRRGSDLYLFNAAYARLKNIQLGFTVPDSWAGRAGLQKARLYLVGQNLLTISQLKFLDPEVSEFNGNLSNSGANSGRAYPTPVYYGVGLDITFK
ncbi:SusC/RagA family TonB-linked outer membrane protein [Niabella aurantiaca]|uniref:SusC/RagA family TonB-linked outer membrane protein n=1 Tax=Niabella aurantiaca TaxID=379900 RepID=UPI00039A888B|nr:SusC/RagA family TonB-linked outer membrane protein [Niabella aurantiaca]